MSARTGLQSPPTATQPERCEVDAGLGMGASPKVKTLQRHSIASPQLLRSPVDESHRATMPTNPSPQAAPSRNAMKANSLIASRNRGAASRHRMTAMADFRASTSTHKPLIIEETRESMDTARAVNVKETHAEREQPISSPPKSDWSTSPSKIRSQTQTQNNSTKHLESRRALQLVPISPLDRTIGVEEGAGWFSPSNGASRGDSEDERDISQQPSVISLPREPSPTPLVAPISARSKIAMLRTFRSKSPAFKREQYAVTETPNVHRDQTTDYSSKMSTKELEHGLETACVALKEEKASSFGSGSSSRSSLSQTQLKDVATRAMKLASIKADEEQSNSMVDTSAQVVLNRKRDQHRARKAQSTDSSATSQGRRDHEAVSPTHTFERIDRLNTTSFPPPEAERLGLLANEPQTISYMSTPMSQGDNRETTRAERYAALKRKAEQRLRNNVELSSSLSDGNIIPPLHPVYGLSSKSITLGISGSRSSDSIPQNPSSGSSISTISSQGGMRASRLATIRNTNPPARALVKAGRHWEAHYSPPGFLETTQEISQLEMHHTPRGSTTIIPTFDDSVELESAVRRKPHAKDHFASAGLYDPLVAEVNTSNRGPSLAVKDSGTRVSYSASKEVATGGPNTYVQLAMPPGEATAGASVASGLHRSNFLHEGKVPEASDLDGLDFSSGDASLSKLLDAPSNDMGSALEQRTDDSRELEHRPIKVLSQTDQSSRRSDLSSDLSAGTQANKNPLRWWQKKYSKTTNRDTNAIITRALETVQPKMWASKPSEDGTEEDVFDGLEETVPDGFPADSSGCKISDDSNKEAAQTRHIGLPADTNGNKNFSETERVQSLTSEAPLSVSTEDSERHPSALMDSSIGLVDSAEQSQMTTTTEPSPDESILIHLGYAFVSYACQGDLLHDEPSSSDHGNGNEGDEESSSSSPYVTPNGYVSPRKTASSSVHDEEQLQWRTLEDSDIDAEVNGDEAEFISIGHTESSRGLVKKSRADAQQELLTHASKALALSRGKPKQLDLSESLKRSSRDDVLPMVTAFIGQLTTNCIEVLKLGRQNKWQYRLLVASTEVVSVSQGGSVPGSWTCPRALLWLKSFDGKASSQRRIKNDGRGGLQFTDLLKVETGFGSIAVPSIPRRQASKFAGLYGVLLNYRNNQGKERLTLLAFKSQIAADTFVAVLDAIKKLLQS